MPRIAMEIQCTTNAVWLRPVAKPTGFQTSLLQVDGNEVPAAKAPCCLMCYSAQTSPLPPPRSLLFSFFIGSFSFFELSLS